MRKQYTLTQKMLRSGKSNLTPEELLTPHERQRIAKICAVVLTAVLSFALVLIVGR